MVAPDKSSDILKRYYYGIVNNSSTYRGPKALYKAVKGAGYKGISLQMCKNFLKSQETYTLYRPARKNYKRNKIIAQEVAELLQFDIMELTDYKAANKGFAYALIATDTFSKYTFVAPLLDKSADSVAKAFESIFQTGYIPRNAYSDNDRAFLSKKMQNLFRKYRVNHYTTTSKVHA